LPALLSQVIGCDDGVFAPLELLARISTADNVLSVVVTYVVSWTLTVTVVCGVSWTLIVTVVCGGCSRYTEYNTSERAVSTSTACQDVCR